MNLNERLLLILLLLLLLPPPVARPVYDPLTLLSRELKSRDHLQLGRCGGNRGTGGESGGNVTLCDTTGENTTGWR
jgi:hypothetical protein